MKRYTELLAITAQAAWDSWYEVSDVACHATATAWNWYVDTFFSAKSAKVYRELGNTLGFAMVCAISLGQTGGFCISPRKGIVHVRFVEA